MQKSSYFIGNYFKFKLRQHCCHRCANSLRVITNSKWVSPTSEEAKYYDFNNGSDVCWNEPCEFYHKVFFCSFCYTTFEVVTQISIEDIKIITEQIMSKFQKKGIDLSIQPSYILKAGTAVQHFDDMCNVDYLHLSIVKDKSEIAVYKVPVIQIQAYDRPYYFNLSKKDLKKFIKKHLSHH